MLLAGTRMYRVICKYKDTTLKYSICRKICNNSFCTTPLHTPPYPHPPKPTSNIPVNYKQTNTKFYQCVDEHTTTTNNNVYYNATDYVTLHNPSASPSTAPTTIPPGTPQLTKFYRCHTPDGHQIKRNDEEGDHLVTMNPKNRRKGLLHKILRRIHVYHTKRVVPKSFRSNLEECLKNVYTGEGADKHIALEFSKVMSEIECARKWIADRNATMVVDKSAKAHLVVASLVLATYQVLADRLEGDHHLVMDLLKQCFCRVGLQSIFAEIMVTIPTLALDPISTIAKSLVRGANVVGDGWNINIMQDPPYNSHTVMKVKKCFYHTFFTNNGAPMLTKLFCAVDNKWFAVLDPMHHGVQYTRNGTLASGQYECTFEFRKMHRSDNLQQIDKPLGSVQ